MSDPVQTKPGVTYTAARAGAGSLAYTGAGTSGAFAVVMVCKRLGVEMSVEEAMVLLAVITVIFTPMLRIGQSLLQQWLAHRGYTLPE